MSKLISIAEASEMLGVTVKTLKIWANQDKIKSFRTAGNHRRFRIDDIKNFLGEGIKAIKTNKDVFIYCRVSTEKQVINGDLEKQKKELIKHCNERGYNIIRIYEDVSSGLNTNRRELAKMFRSLTETNCIVVEYSDRLAGFGFNYLKEFAKSNGVEIETLRENIKLDHNDEMINDLIRLGTFFSARLYGETGGKKLKKVISELETERSENCENNSVSGS